MLGPEGHISQLFDSNQQAVDHKSFLTLSPPAGQLHTDIQMFTHLSPLPFKQSPVMSEKVQKTELQSVSTYVKDVAAAAEGFVSMHVAQKQVQVMSVCFGRLCHEVCCVWPSCSIAPRKHAIACICLVTTKAVP